MKNIVLSAVAVLAMSSFAVAGGDIAPVEEPIVVPEPVITDSGFYLGAAYSLLSVEVDADLGNGLNYSDSSEDYSQFMLQAGYKFNSYVAVEGRYWIGMDDNNWLAADGNGDVTGEIDAWGIYVKPMYPVTDAFDIYALLGYADIDYTESYGNFTQDYGVADGFSWGIGAAYSFTENFSIFVDYVALYDDSSDVVVDNLGGTVAVDTTVDTVNFGVSYQF